MLLSCKDGSKEQRQYRLPSVYPVEPHCSVKMLSSAENNVIFLLFSYLQTVKMTIYAMQYVYMYIYIEWLRVTVIESWIWMEAPFQNCTAASQRGCFRVSRTLTIIMLWFLFMCFGLSNVMWSTNCGLWQVFLFKTCLSLLKVSWRIFLGSGNSGNPKASETELTKQQLLQFVKWILVHINAEIYAERHALIHCIVGSLLHAQ